MMSFSLQRENAMQTNEIPKQVTKHTRFSEMLQFNTNKIALGGHRGSGANAWSAMGPETARAQFRENTISSFLAAVNAGATFLEFDVQVTSDGVPIIFHDNYLVFGDSASPTSSLVKNVSLSDFKALAPIKTALSDLASSSILEGASDDDVMSTAHMPLDGGSPMGWNSSIVSGGSPAGTSPRGNRLMRQHNNEVPAIPFEPSLQPWHVDKEDDFPTLLEVFNSIPLHVAFDIEIKMTTPSTVERTPMEEIERMLSATMDIVQLANKRAESAGLPRRHVMFSSFDPDACLAIKEHRPDAIVMFLSGGGAYQHVDTRRTSIRSAIDFALSAKLEGIIIEASMLQQQQYMVLDARQKGLQVCSYGIDNDNPLWVLRQEELGVHAVIVDDVDRIVDALAR